MNPLDILLLSTALAKTSSSIYNGMERGQLYLAADCTRNALCFSPFRLKLTNDDGLAADPLYFEDVSLFYL